ncbi:sugar transferase [Poseidonocella sedimentorum]|uniref:sugar transferase n=1 Tax=Poseidonocella sedimentorum TaxID=871652 RepID=UPI001FE50181|nr:sugar transferase [Poseidonocella sedimentorum]
MGRAPGQSGGWKRGLDIVLALALVLPVALIVAVLWGLVRLDGGPGFYGHRRVGEGGRAFKCWKLRSMQVDADRALERHLQANPAAAREWAASQKLTHDPRVTPLGRILRATSLDELPQLWNVLRGEMSFVGPRPVTGHELMRYGALDWAYLSGKPGITGAWQVSGRNDLSYETRVHLDAAYRSQETLLTDLKIIAKTALEVLKRSGR